MLAIRPFQELDWDVLLDLANQAVPFAPAANEEWFNLRRSFDSVHYKRRHYLAWQGFRPLGYAGLEQQGAGLERLRVYVVAASEHLNGEAGTRLFAQLLADARELGARSLWARELLDDANARAFFESCGFMETQRAAPPNFPPVVVFELKLALNAERFYERVTTACALPAAERHGRLARLHAEVMAAYLAAVARVGAERAAEAVADGRTVQQVVGHIAEWERFGLLSAGDILAGLAHPRMITSVAGFVEPGGQALDFDGIDTFNAYAGARHTGVPWAETQALALDTARILGALFSQPALLSAERLERTRPFRKRLQNGALIRDVAMGWNLWITLLEHEAVEHAADLQLPEDNGEP